MTWIMMGLACFQTTPDSTIWDGYWHRIHLHESEGKFASALRVADSLYEVAKQSDHTVQICKSMSWRLRRIASLQENGVSRAIDLLKQELPDLSDASAAIVSVNAAAYLRQLGHGFFSQHTNAHLAVRAFLDSAIFHADTLKRCKVSDYSELVTSTSGAELRPTLYDLVVWEAIDFFSQSEADTFRIRPSIQTQAFLAGPVHGRIASLFKDLLLFHAEDSNRSAYVHVNLQRLRHPWFKSNDTASFESELLSILEDARSFPIGAEVMFELARFHAVAGLLHVTAMESSEHVECRSAFTRDSVRHLSPCFFAWRRDDVRTKMESSI